MEQYDTIAEAYRDSRQLPFRDAVEKPTLLRLLGDVRGKSILDMGCGDGHYTRLVKRAGAREVTGVDISAEMIRLAEEEENLRPVGCVYSQHDASKYESSRQVDLVLASHLLHYAKTTGDLRKFCETCHQALRKGGRIVGIIANVHNSDEGLASWKGYGLEMQYPVSRRDGGIIKVRFTNLDGETFEIENYYHSPETYRMAFERAGFSNFRWAPLSLSCAERRKRFLEDYMKAPPIEAFLASRSLC